MSNADAREDLQEKALFEIPAGTQITPEYLFARFSQTIIDLRADLAAVTEERDAAKRNAYEDAACFIEENVFNYSSGDQNYWNPRKGGNTQGLEYAREFRARAALEGVTGPANTQTGER